MSRRLRSAIFGGNKVVGGGGSNNKENDKVLVMPVAAAPSSSNNNTTTTKKSSSKGILLLSRKSRRRRSDDDHLSGVKVLSERVIAQKHVNTVVMEEANKRSDENQGGEGGGGGVEDLKLHLTNNSNDDDSKTERNIQHKTMLINTMSSSIWENKFEHLQSELSSCKHALNEQAEIIGKQQETIHTLQDEVSKFKLTETELSSYKHVMNEQTDMIKKQKQTIHTLQKEVSKLKQTVVTYGNEQKKPKTLIKTKIMPLGDVPKASNISNNNMKKSPFSVGEPNKNDVLCGPRTKQVISHPGNQNYKKLLKANFQMYAEAKNGTKCKVSESILVCLQTLDPPGRFLKKDKDLNIWIEMNPDNALKKISQGLRDASKETK